MKWLVLTMVLAACGNTANMPKGPITKIEQGLAAASDTEATPFVALPDPATAQLVTGGQGLTMVVGRLRFSGPDVPEYVNQTTELIDPTSKLALASLNGLITSFPEAGSTARTTRPMFLPGVFNVTKTVRYVTAVGSLAVSKDLALLEAPPGGRRCLDAFNCAMSCQLVAGCVSLCTSGLSSDGSTALAGLLQCGWASCPGDSDAGMSQCSGAACVACVQQAVAGSCNGTYMACMNVL